MSFSDDGWGGADEVAISAKVIEEEFSTIPTISEQMESSPSLNQNVLEVEDSDIFNETLDITESVMEQTQMEESGTTDRTVITKEALSITEDDISLDITSEIEPPKPLTFGRSGNKMQLPPPSRSAKSSMIGAEFGKPIVNSLSGQQIPVQSKVEPFAQNNQFTPKQSFGKISEPTQPATKPCLSFGKQVESGTTSENGHFFGTTKSSEVGNAPDIAEESQEKKNIVDSVPAPHLKPSGFGGSVNSTFGKSIPRSLGFGSENRSDQLPSAGFGGGSKFDEKMPESKEKKENTTGFGGSFGSNSTKKTIPSEESKQDKSKFAFGFGGSQPKTETSDVTQNKFNVPSSRSIKPSGFGSVNNNTAGFGKVSAKTETDESSTNFEKQETVKSGGFGGANKPFTASGFGNSNREFGGSSNEGKLGFGSIQKQTDSSQNERTCFGETAEKTGFGRQSTGGKSEGFGSSQQRTDSSEHGKGGFGGSSEKSAFGATNAIKTMGPSSKGFGAKSYGFGSMQKQTSSSEHEKTEFGTSEKSKFGSFNKSTEPGSNEFGRKSGGFGSSQQRTDSSEHEKTGFGETAEKSGFGRQLIGGKSEGFGSGQQRTDSSAHEKKGFGFNKPVESNSKGFGGGFSSAKSIGFVPPKSTSTSSGLDISEPSDSKSSGFGQNNGSQKPSFGQGFGSKKFSEDAPSNDFQDGGFGQTKKMVKFGVSDDGFGRNGDEEPRQRGCFNCGEEGHRKSECPMPQKTSACRNCGEEGHFSRECEKPKVPLYPCKNCGKEGHFTKECPEERVRVDPTEPCRRCNEEGHWSSECPSRPRDLQGNILVSYDIAFTAEEKLFDDAVNNDDKIDFEQKVVTSMGGQDIPDMASFDEFKVLPPEISSNLRLMKMSRPTPIQRAAFYPILNGSDVVACAHTGSGKTLAFLVPLVISLLDDHQNNAGTGADESPSPRLLIVSPTRELVNQTYNVARQLTYKTGLTCGLAYGGFSRNGNVQHLRSFDKLNILVATMGRLQDLIESGDVSLSKMKFVVLDEADRMVDSTDFGEEVLKVIGPPETRTQQTILFSASFSENLQEGDLPKIVKTGFLMLQVDKFGTANEKITQRIMLVNRSDKRSELYKLLGIDENNFSVLQDAPIEKQKTIIFVNSVKFCDTLASNIVSCGVPCTSMHSHQNQEQRDRTLEDFRRGGFKCIVASNVCARGLNIAGLDHVINYDLPDERGYDEYINRIGRTARAGFTGMSTAFLDEEKDQNIAPYLINVLKEANQEIPEWLTNLNNGAQYDVETIGEEEDVW